MDYTSETELRVRVEKLEKRVDRLSAVLRVLFALLRLLQPDLKHLRVSHASDKARLLRAIDRSRHVLGLRRILRIIGLSPSRLSAWRRATLACELADRSACPRFSPHELTAEEVSAIRAMVTSPDFRHGPTGRLAILAQRLGRVSASPSTWYRLVRERGWRRPRLRIHPKGPRVGIRASKPDEIWHIDTTLIRLLDGTRVYLHAIIDNFSRRILSWRLNEHFDPASSADLLVEAGRSLIAGASPPTLLADGGVENYNGSVDEVIASGLLRRVLARAEVSFSNSLIEAWWRVLKHGWLFLNQLDSAACVRKLVAFYVEEHDTRLPHAAFQGLTPDEMHSGMGTRSRTTRGRQDRTPVAGGSRSTERRGAASAPEIPGPPGKGGGHQSRRGNGPPRVEPRRGPPTGPLGRPRSSRVRTPNTFGRPVEKSNKTYRRSWHGARLVH